MSNTAHAGVLAYQLLLAEDDLDLREIFREALEGPRMTVTAVADGARALELVVADPMAFDAALFDVRMPVMTGLEVLRVMRNRNLTLPVLLMTSFADDELRREALGLGAAGVLQKPFDVDQLRRAVADAIVSA